jgi:hypothetical protein
MLTISISDDSLEDNHTGHEKKHHAAIIDADEEFARKLQEELGEKNPKFSQNYF